jgi:glycosyltransferase involved in cell wall biosynthesis
VVVGDGPARKDLEAQCLSAVFTGFQTGENLAACYASSDLFLFPSLTETFGNVTPEAMASGLAMVAFDDAAAGQLIKHHDNGLLAQKIAPEEFFRLATELACNARLRSRLGSRARETALQLGWGNIIQKIEDQYAAAIAKAHNAALPRVWARAPGV